MKLQVSDYYAYLQIKLGIAEEIYKNTVTQSYALKKNDEHLLKKLLNDRQKCIERLDAIGCASDIFRNIKKDVETEKLEQSIQYLSNEITRINHMNVEQAEELKGKIGNSIAHITCGRKAIQNGYFRKIPSQYGYFIDRKIGKSYRV
ncbi:hypothetical protein [Petroclostridium sp. X23]|uniref:hypothetical protein n=1 Tax=Petroclostridium sp. X23 TaxID=3045146 RepID=UPI0024AE5C9B|nr:hypothetical protein [Petroclostridium sp. X23]WHH58753.1 hypothetical protein QKW49_23670 [Petroclostridium sp. X23]